MKRIIASALLIFLFTLLIFSQETKNERANDSPENYIPLKILSKPSAKYTSEAYQNQFSGTVRLSVTFLKNGQIGEISPVYVLPFGLTEQAIAAAGKIKFEPQREDSKPVTTTKLVEYVFWDKV